jgi:hypothetical protein
MYHLTELAPKEKATNYFADTICEFSEQLTPEELHQALLNAMESYYLNTKKQFDHAAKLRDLFTVYLK